MTSGSRAPSTSAEPETWPGSSISGEEVGEAETGGAGSDGVGSEGPLLGGALLGGAMVGATIDGLTGLMRKVTNQTKASAPTSMSPARTAQPITSGAFEPSREGMRHHRTPPARRRRTLEGWRAAPALLAISWSHVVASEPALVDRALGPLHGLCMPESLGGNAFGDVPLRSDRSVRIRVPARRLLLIQGIDAEGSVVRQHARVFALPGGHDVDGSVTRAAYPSQCGTCHGNVDPGATFQGLASTADIPFVPLDVDTEAMRQPIVDLSAAGVTPRLATFLHTIRPLLDRACVECHSGASPAGELSLEDTYSTVGNFPAGRWATDPGASPPGYEDMVPASERVPAYNWSVAWTWFFQREDAPYRVSTELGPLISSFAPISALAPWDPGYQNLFAANGIDRLRYLGGFRNSNFGRGDREGGNSRDAWLIEILSGRDVDPTLTFTGPDHTGFLTDAEIRDVMSVMDVGFPYMAHCDDHTVPSGPNVGEPWGDIDVTQFDDATR